MTTLHEELIALGYDVEYRPEGLSTPGEFPEDSEYYFPAFVIFGKIESLADIEDAHIRAMESQGVNWIEWRDDLRDKRALNLRVHCVSRDLHMLIVGTPLEGEEFDYVLSPDTL